MSRDLLFILTTIKEWCIFIAPYAAIAILPAMIVRNKIMSNIMMEV